MNKRKDELVVAMFLILYDAMIRVTSRNDISYLISIRTAIVPYFISVFVSLDLFCCIMHLVCHRKYAFAI